MGIFHEAARQVDHLAIKKELRDLINYKIGMNAGHFNVSPDRMIKQYAASTTVDLRTDDHASWCTVFIMLQNQLKNRFHHPPG